MALLTPFFRRKLRTLDITSPYAFVVEVTAVIVSMIVTLITFFKLVFRPDTGILLSVIISLIVFYIFTEIYSFLALSFLKFIENTDKKP
ncbi:MAG: hypothetical protein M3Q73_03265 [bacterium]|nr:hypothetical protein [bacterium]